MAKNILYSVTLKLSESIGYKLFLHKILVLDEQINTLIEFWHKHNHYFLYFRETLSFPNTLEVYMGVILNKGMIICKNFFREF